MKNICYVLALTTFLLSCSEGSKNKAENISVVKNYIQAVEDLDFNAMEALLDENYQGLGPSFTDSINKKEALESWKINVEELYKGIKYKKVQNAAVEISDGPNKGDWVSSWAELLITYKDDVEITLWANTMYAVRNGKIVKTFTFYNEADAYWQLGYRFTK